MFSIASTLPFYLISMLGRKVRPKMFLLNYLLTVRFERPQRAFSPTFCFTQKGERETSKPGPLCPGSAFGLLSLFLTRLCTS